jgi:hypothetical protein
MLLVLIGPPSPLLERAGDALSKIFEQKFGGLKIVKVKTAPAFKKILAGKKAGNIAIAIEVLSDGLAELVDEALCPVIFVGDALDTVLSHTCDVLKLNEVMALRYVSKILATAAHVAGYRRTLKIGSLAAKSDNILIRVLMAYLGLQLSTDEQGAVIRQLAPPAAQPGAPKASGLSAPTIAAANQALKFYEPVLTGRSIVQSNWPSPLFSVPDPRAASTWEAGKNPGFLSSDFDLTGPGRLLFFGPYLCLPRGRWKVSAQFSVTGNETGNVLQLDALAHPDGAAATILFEAQTDLPDDGDFVASFYMNVVNAAAPISIRGFLMRGSIDKGGLKFRHVEIEKA